MRDIVIAVLILAASAEAAAPPTVDVVRDRFGVPHLFTAARGEDALAAAAYATGWVQAEDRLFEMDVFRRAARGRLAELAALGAAYLPMDIEARRDGSTPAQLARAVEQLEPRDRRLLAAFRAGVNRFIDEATADPSLLPIEYLGQPPEPWTEGDTLAIGELQLGRFGVGGGNELANARFLAELRARFDEATARGIFDDVVWIDDPSAPVTIAPAEQTFRPLDRPVRFAPAQMALVDRLGAAMGRAADRVATDEALLRVLAARLPIPRPAGHASNAIVVAGRLTASGHPILLGGPQTGLSIPSFFWEVAVRSGDRASQGVALPGTPGITMGRTDRFAFTITSAADDDTDVYAEILDPADPGRYLHRGESLPFERRTETFLVAGSAPVTREYLRSVHGPLLVVDEAAGVAFSRRRALDGRAARAGAEALHLALARSLHDFLAIARGIEAGLNFHVADVDGNIAYVHAGRRPGRPHGTDPRLPLLGTGEHEWTRAHRRRPQVVNPQSGVIVNWNNKPAAGWPCGDQPEFWGPIDRVLGLTDALAAEMARGPLTPERVNAVMRHAATSDVFASRIVPFLHGAVAAVPADAADRARLVEADAAVAAWVDAGAPLVAVGQHLPHPGATLYRAWRTAAQRLVLRDELGSAFRPMSYPLVNDGNQEDDHGSFGTPDALFHRVLMGSAAALPPSRNYFDDVVAGTSATRDAVLVEALRAALSSLAARFDSDDMTAWLEPQLLETYMNLGAVDVFFGPTVAERQNRGSYNLLVELGVSGGGQIILPPGESGAIPAGALGSEPTHLRDQLPLFAAFTYRRMPDTRAAIEGPITGITLTVPVGL